MAASSLAGESRNSLTVSAPNGYATVVVDDLSLASTGGPVRFGRVWNGQEWQFNPHWESLSQSWKNLTGSQVADTTGGTTSSGSSPTTSSSGGNDGCWVWVDEDWEPTAGTTVIGGEPEMTAMQPERMTPFNRVMGETSGDYIPLTRVNIDYASLCPGVILSSGVQDAEGIRRQNELYLGDAGRYAFSNVAILEKRAVQQLPEEAAASLSASLATGQINLNPITNPKGYRWLHKEGDWIDYNTQGQVVAYGDKNNNLVWFARDTNGILRGVVDAHGRVLITLHYSGGLLTEVRDYPIAGVSEDLVARSIKYQYDTKNRLTVMTDARGNTTRYDYDPQNRIIKLTDAEGRIELLSYNGEVVKQRTAPDGTVTDYLFEYDDANKQFTSQITHPVTSAGRRKEDLTHNRVGKLVRKITNSRTDEEVRYDTAARAELKTNARGFTTKTTRNEFEQVIGIDYPDGTFVRQSYSPLHLKLLESIDEAGVKTQYEYDTKGNLLKMTEAAGTPAARITEYQVNALGQTTRVTRKGRTEANGTSTPDAVWLLEYDERGQIKKVTDAENGIWQLTFDRAGNLVKLIDPRTKTTRYEVDPEGNLTKITDALGQVRLLTYDKVGNLVTYTDARTKLTQAAYDALNRNTRITNPVGGVYRLQYNGEGMPTSETDEDNRTRQSVFDNFLRLTRTVDGIGNATNYGYTIADGSQSGLLGSLIAPTSITSPGFTQQLRYDARERPTSDTLLNPSAEGVASLPSNRSYDARGRVKTETDAYGKLRSFSYDALGQLIETTDSLNHKTKALYDARGNLIQLTDAENNVHRFEYDRNRRLTKEILPLGQSITYSYDGSGNLIQRIDQNGFKTTLLYDDLNRVIEARRFDAANVPLRTTTYGWDAENNQTSWSDTDLTRPAGQQTTSAVLTYDDAGRKTSETVSYPNPAGDSYSLSYSYAYSLAGNKTKLIWADGTEIVYGYSGHGELESVTIPGEGNISVNQFQWLSPARTTLPGGSVQERSYDGLLNLESLELKNPGQQLTLDLENRYGKLLELKTSARSDTVEGASSTKNRGFSYDDEIRLLEVESDSGGMFTDTETYSLDAVGNRIAHSEVGGAWTYDGNNRLIQRGTGGDATTYAYDDAGNLTERTEPNNQITRFSYDSQNRLTSVRDGQNNLIARYGYDPLNRRTWKEQYRDGAGAPLTQAIRTYYLYSEEALIAEATQAITLNAADGSVSATLQPQISTQYGPKPDNPFTTGVLFVKTKNSNNQDVVAYYHHDHLGTPIQATDKNGYLVWSASYNAFGEASITTPAATEARPTIVSNLRLPGQYYDEETGLHYNWNRYYDKSTGRYVTPDPIRMAGGLNYYLFAWANPLQIIDPTGLHHEGNGCVDGRGNRVPCPRDVCATPECAAGILPNPPSDPCVESCIAKKETAKTVGRALCKWVKIAPPLKAVCRAVVKAADLRDCEKDCDEKRNKRREETKLPDLSATELPVCE